MTRLTRNWSITAIVLTLVPLAACVPIMVAQPNGGIFQGKDNAYDFGARTRSALEAYPLELKELDERMWVVQTHRLDQPILGDYGRNVLYVKGRFAADDSKIFLIKPNEDGTIGYIRTKRANISRDSRANLGLGKIADLLIGQSQTDVEIRTFKPEIASIDVSFRQGYTVIRLPAGLPPGDYVVTDQQTSFIPFAIEHRTPSLTAKIQHTQQQSRLFHVGIEYTFSRSQEDATKASTIDSDPTLPTPPVELSNNLVSITPGFRLPLAPGFSVDLDMGPGVGRIGDGTLNNAMLAWTMRIRPVFALIALPKSHGLLIGAGIEATSRAALNIESDDASADADEWKLGRPLRYSVFGDLEWQPPFRYKRFQVGVRMGAGYDIPGRAPMFRLGAIF